MLRSLRWLVLWPFALFGWLGRALFLLFRGYDSLILELEGTLTDLPRPTTLFGRLRGAPRGTALLPLLGALRRAEKDPRLLRVVVRMRELGTGLGRAEELSEALTRVADAGKEVIVFADQLDLGGYLIALGGSRIVLSPPGRLEVTGVAAELTFYKGLLDQIGVKAHLSGRGKYKSAKEPFTRDAPSDANAEMTDALVNDLYTSLVDRIAARRKLDVAEVRERIDRGPFRAPDAAAEGLVDEVRYADELQTALEETGPRWRPVRLGQYLKLTQRLAGRGKKKRVAVVFVSGQIVTGRGSVGGDDSRATGSRSFGRALERLRKSARVDAVLLRVNSPGGSALASDLMWRSVQRLREKKPVVVSMANVAASGGYYLAGVEDVTIFANPCTVTGSIGVVGGRFDARALYDKLGIQKTLFKRGEHAGHHSTFSAPSAADTARTEREIDVLYREFVGKMAVGRRMPIAELDAVAEGRVWTGAQAQERRLVDHLGGLARAFDHLRDKLGVGAEGRLELDFAASGPRLGIGALLFGREDPEDRVLDALPQEIAHAFRGARHFEGESAFALLPFELRFW